MSLSDKKIEISMAGLGIIVVMGLIHVNKASFTPVQKEQDVVYEMPRPKLSFLSALFSLGDREVERKYINPFEKKKAVNKEAKVQDQTKKALPVVQAKKALAPKSVSALPVAKKMDVTIIPASENAPFSGGDDWKLAQGNSRPGISFSDNNQNKSATDSGNVEQQGDKMSGAQWRALILSEPTIENIQKMISAFRGGDLDSSSYYAIAEELFVDGRPERIGMAVALVKAAYTATSFTLAAQYADQVPVEFQNDLNEFLASFAIASRFSALAGALQAKNPEVVEIALQVVMNGYAKAKSGESVASDPREQRGQGKVTSVEEFNKFIPIFQTLSSSGNSVISAQALAALSQMQTTVASL